MNTLSVETLTSIQNYIECCAPKQDAIVIMTGVDNNLNIDFKVVLNIGSVFTSGLYTNIKIVSVMSDKVEILGYVKSSDVSKINMLAVLNNQK